MSTNALERTKKLELLKSAGLLQNNKRSPSFADKLNDAVVNLGLGLGEGGRVVRTHYYLERKC